MLFGFEGIYMTLLRTAEPYFLVVVKRNIK